MTDSADSGFSEDRVRDAPEIARRALTLFAVVAIAFGSPKADLLAWLHAESLWAQLTPQELAFVSTDAPARRHLIEFTWRSEAVLVLLWAIGKIDGMPGLGTKCNASEFRAILPPFAKIGVEEFIRSIRRRSDETLNGMAVEVMHAHWQVRDARIRSSKVPTEIDPGIVQERHHAINWVVGYMGSPWDEVATDT